MSVSVLLADDHPIVRQGVATLLGREGFEVVAEADDGHGAVELASRHRPDVAVVDCVMPRLNGLDAAIQIQRLSPNTQTVLLTMYTDDQYVLEAFRCGLRGYVLKTQAATDIAQALREVVRGGMYVSPGISQTIIQACFSKAEVPSDPLTPREREVLQLVAEGRTTKEVAEVLGLSVKTADTHRTRIMQKLDIHQIAGLVRYAIRRGLVQA
jgi:DNA-binding NarL/FixJ family response regulator